MRGMRAALLLSLLLVPALAAARPGGSLPRTPVLPGGPGPRAAPAPAPLDTVTAPVVLPVGGGALRVLAVLPDTVTFGGVAWVVAEADPTGAAADTLQLPGWLEPAPAAGPPPAASAVAAGAYVLPVRVYGIQPFRLEAGGRVSGVVTVLGRGTDGTLTAPVRDPRTLGWNGGVLVAALLVLGALAWLGYRLWRRRRDPGDRPLDRPVAGPAWPRLVLDLEALLADADASGDGRLFLDRLAALARGYAADRFGIAGREMTGAEIAAACRRLGYPAATGRAFARLVDALDARRFAPAPVAMAWCRDRAADLLAAVAAVRIVPDPAAPDTRTADLAAAEAAWRRLTATSPGSGGEAA